MESSGSVFADVKYYFPESIPESVRENTQSALDEHGATEVTSIDDATHIITTSLHFEGWQNVPIQVAVTTPYWVERSVFLGKLQSPNHYSADPTCLFSGVVACASDVSSTDREILAAGITALGGQWRDGLVRDVTHMFCLTKTSDKYNSAMQFRLTTGVKVLLPHWFDDVIKLGYACIDTRPYEWPEPSCLHPPLDNEEGGKKPKVELDPIKKALFRTVSWDPTQDLPRSATVNVWKGKRILLGDSFDFAPERLQGLEEFIKRGGGKIVKWKKNIANDEVSKISECDIYATKFRRGKAFTEAVKTGKMIGTLAWLFHVHATGVISHPRDQLLHYPVPSKGPDQVRDQIISISNYTGDAREYLKKLIHSLGANFTPNMTGKNTLLIAAHKDGIKVQKATMWHMPIVNHIWLEDCFIEWKHVSLTQAKYSTFPPGMDFTSVLGERSLPRLEEDRAQQEVHEAESAPPPPTATSARDAMEVEAITMDNNAMDIDIQPTSPAKSSSSLTKSRARTVGLATPSTARPASKQFVPPKSDDDGVRPSSSRIATGGPTSSPLSSSPSRPLQQKRRVILIDEDEPEDDSPTKGKGKSQPAKKPTKSTRTIPPPDPDEDVEMNEVEEISPPKPPPRRVKPRPVARCRQKAIPVQDDEQPTEVEEMAPPSSLPTKTPTKSAPNTKVEVSVVVPRLEDTLKKQGSMVASSAERKSSRGTVSPVKSVANTDISQHAYDSSGRIRRAAATMATQKLHDEVMPDVLNYQQEMRRKGRRSSGSHHHVEPESVQGAAKDEEEEPRIRKRKKPTKESETAEKSKTKRRKSTPSEQVDEEDADENQSVVTAHTAKARGGKSATKSISLLTTQVTLSDKEISSLSKLGMKMVTRPQECTHLLAPKIARTEKFLCAMAHGPFVLRKEWALECIANKRVMPEEDYILEDSENETKFQFKIADAIQKGKRNKGKLFDKHTFYVTPNINTKGKDDTVLLVSVGKACGATMKVQNPKERVLQKPNTHLITCEEDESIWVDFDESIPLYSKELIYTSALRQEVDWDESEFLVSR